MISPKAARRFRHWVLTWVYLPIATTILLIGALAILGNMAGPNAQGPLGSLGFGAAILVILVPVLAAHLVVMASVVGVIGMLAGLAPDWKLVATTLFGLTAGGMVLFRAYGLIA